MLRKSDIELKDVKDFESITGKGLKERSMVKYFILVKKVYSKDHMNFQMN